MQEDLPTVGGIIPLGKQEATEYVYYMYIYMYMTLLCSN